MSSGLPIPTGAGKLPHPAMPPSVTIGGNPVYSIHFGLPLVTFLFSILLHTRDIRPFSLQKLR